MQHCPHPVHSKRKPSLYHFSWAKQELFSSGRAVVITVISLRVNTGENRLTNLMEKSLLNLEEIESKLGLKFQNRELLTLSFVHRSFWNENQTLVKGHNERLEFLGDSVLGLILAEYLYTHFPHLSEGVLSDLRSRLVEAQMCVQYIQKLRVASYVLLGKGEMKNPGKGRESILADLFEAIVGAVYLDGGYLKAQEFFFAHYTQEVEALIAQPAQNWKAELQDYAQKKYQTPPVYEVIQECGPAHQKQFKIAVFINNEKVAIGEGSSKKQAQQDAAHKALTKLSS